MGCIGVRSLRVCVLLSLILSASAAFADTVPISVSIRLTGVNGAIGNGVYVGPYYGLVNGNAVTLICDDYVNVARIGQTHDAYVSTFADLSHTLYGAAAGALDKYRQVAWLSDQFASTSTSVWGDIHFALWSIFNPTVVPLSTGASWWRSQAILNGTGNTAMDARYVIYTPVIAGASQEFLSPIPTPEPESIVLLATSLLGAVFLRRRMTRLN
jgi:hypothetical protein